MRIQFQHVLSRQTIENSGDSNIMQRFKPIKDLSSLRNMIAAVLQVSERGAYGSFDAPFI